MCYLCLIYILHLAVKTARQSAQRDEKFLDRVFAQKLSRKNTHAAASTTQTGAGAFLAPQNLPSQGYQPLFSWSKPGGLASGKPQSVYVCMVVNFIR
jgi:hypothetical protein